MFATRTFPFRSGKSFSVKLGFGGYICVHMLENGGFGGRGGAVIILSNIILSINKCRHNIEFYKTSVSNKVAERQGLRRSNISSLLTDGLIGRSG